MVATRRLKDEPDRLLLLGARLAAGEHSGERGALLLYNPNHDAKGRFAAGSGGSSARGAKSAKPRQSGKASGGKTDSTPSAKQSKPIAEVTQTHTMRRGTNYAYKVHEVTVTHPDGTQQHLKIVAAEFPTKTAAKAEAIRIAMRTKPSYEAEYAKAGGGRVGRLESPKAHDHLAAVARYEGRHDAEALHIGLASAAREMFQHSAALAAIKGRSKAATVARAEAERGRRETQQRINNLRAQLDQYHGAPVSGHTKKASDPTTGVLLYNPNHDAKGKFASGGGSGGGKSSGGAHHNVFNAPVSAELKAAADRFGNAGTRGEVRAAAKEYNRQLDIHMAKYGTGASKRSAEIRLRSAELAKVAGSKKSSPGDAQKARDELNALKHEQVQVKRELDARYNGVRHYDNYGKTVAKSTAKTTTSHATGHMSKEARAAQNAELVKQGYRDWSSGHAYLSNAGHYRVRETYASGRGTGKSHAAPWSKAVKSAHANNSEFHQAAETYAKAHPNEIPAHYITSAGVRQTSEPSKPMRRTLRFPDALQRVQRFDETGPDGFHRSWIMLFPVGHYQHEQYGELDFTPAKLQKIKAQYDQRVRHIDAALDVDHRASHDDSRATGWIESLELRDRQPDGTPAGLWGCIKWTPYGLKFLNADEYRYFSPEFGPWDDPQTGEHFEDVLIGGALTNRPFLKTMPAIALADEAKGGGKDAMAQTISRKPWGSIDKACLPASCFLIVGDPAKKGTWRLPVYEGAGPRDADGNYTKRGALNINGVKAAWAAVNGAHTGEPMSGVPATVIAKLKAWKAQYFPGDGSKTAKQAMEGRVSRKLGGLASVDADLLDDEDEDDESLTLADGRPAKGSAAMKAQMAALRAKSSLKMGKKKSGKSAADDSEDDADELAEDDEDENAAMAEDAEDDETYDEADGDGPDEELAEDADDAEQYADAADAEDDDVDPEDDEEEGDDEGDDEDETPAPKAKSGRSGRSGQRGAGKPMTSKRMMGARTAVSGGAHVRAAEAGRSLTLAEQQRLTEENARLKYQLYEVEVEKTLTEWKRGKFQFKESAKGTPKTGRIALSKAFSDAFRAWMRAEGVRLSEASRTRVLGLVEIALSSAVVDLSERGGSYDPDGRMVASSARRKAGDDDRLQQAAERIALAEHGKSINALTEEPEKVLAIYSRAADEMRY